MTGMKNGIPEQCYYDLLVWKDEFRFNDKMNVLRIWWD